MKVGQVYIFADEHRDPFIFLVLSAIDNYRMSDADPVDRTVYSVLVLDGEIKLPDMRRTLYPARSTRSASPTYAMVTHRPGTTFELAERFALAMDVKPL